ncbi:MAG: hypothetical protein J5722_09250 [Oscillospiraceae bacterium]|nr:hypothetical protein [Oscillospiraceae bacterium]
MKKGSSAYWFYDIAALLLAVGFFLTHVWSFLILAVMAMAFGLSAASKVPKSAEDAEPEEPAKRKPGKKLLIFLGTALFLFLTPPITIRSGEEYQYPFQRRLIGLYRNVKEPEWFPEFLPDIRSDYCFEYLPSIMQGSGYYDVRFVTTPERAAEYLAQFSASAQETHPLPECDTEANVLRINTAFFGENSGAVVCIMDTNRYQNHPHSGAVIVDPDSGKIELSQYG